MDKSKKLDFSALLGFSAVNEQAGFGIDFQNGTVGARLGAKISTEVTEPAVWPAGER